MKQYMYVPHGFHLVKYLLDWVYFPSDLIARVLSHHHDFTSPLSFRNSEPRRWKKTRVFKQGSWIQSEKTLVLFVEWPQVNSSFGQVHIFEINNQMQPCPDQSSEPSDLVSVPSWTKIYVANLHVCREHGKINSKIIEDMWLKRRDFLRIS